MHLMMRIDSLILMSQKNNARIYASFWLYGLLVEILFFRVLLDLLLVCFFIFVSFSLWLDLQAQATCVASDSLTMHPRPLPPNTLHF